MTADKPRLVAVYSDVRGAYKRALQPDDMTADEFRALIAGVEAAVAAEHPDAIPPEVTFEEMAR